MPESTAVIQFVGQDNGLLAVVGNNTKAFSELTTATASGAEEMANYSISADAAKAALDATALSAVGAVQSINSSAIAAQGAYRTITSNSDRVVTAADTLNNKFLEMTLSVAGLGTQTEAINSVLQPTAGFFSSIAGEATGLGKAFTILNAVEKPLEATLSAVVSVTSDFAASLAALGPAGEAASGALQKIGDSAQALENRLKATHAVGNLYLDFEHLKEDITEIVGTIAGLSVPIAGAVSSIVRLSDLQGKAVIAAGILSVTTTGTVKHLAELYTKADIVVYDIKLHLEGIKVVTDALIDATLHAKDFNKALANVRNLGVDTSSAELITSLGVIGERLIFDTEASKKFAETAVAAFARVQDSISYVTTLPAGMTAGIPALSKQLGELVNGPLQNAVTKGEAAAAMYQTLSAGIGATTGKLKESQPFMEAALKLSSGTETAAGTTVEALAKVSYAYNLNVKEAAKTAAKLNGVVEEGIVTFPQLAGNIGRVAGVAAQAKVPLNEMLGSIAAMTKTMSADDAMTSYVSILNSIAGQGDQASKAANELGVQFNLQAVKAKGLLAVLKELYDKSGGNIEKIKEIIPDSVAFAGSLNLMTTAFAAAKEKTDLIGQKTGTDLNNLFGARQQSLIKQTTALMNGFQEALTDFGEKFQEHLQPGMNTLKEMLTNFQKLPEPIKDFIGAIVTFNAGIEKFMGFVGIFFGALSSLVGIFISIRLQAVLMSETVRGELVQSFKDLGAAIWAGEGRMQSLSKVFKTFIGVTEIQNAASAGLTKTQEGLGRVNGVLNSDLRKLTTGYWDNALAAEKAAIANELLAKKMQEGGVVIEGAASSIHAAPVDVMRKRQELLDKSFNDMTPRQKVAQTVKNTALGTKETIFQFLGLNSERDAKFAAGQVAQTLVGDVEAEAAIAVSKMNWGQQFSIVAQKAMADLGNAFESSIKSFSGFDRESLKIAGDFSRLRTGAAEATGGLVLYDAEFAASQSAMKGWQSANILSIEGLKNFVKGLMVAREVQGGATAVDGLAAKAKLFLAGACNVLAPALELVGEAIVTVWASFGPLLVILGSLVVAFQLLGEVVSFDVMGFKSAASEAKDYAKTLAGVTDQSKELTAALGEQDKQIDKTYKGYANKIDELQKKLDSTDDSKGREALQKKIDDLEKLKVSAKETEDKQYKGFMANVMRLSEATTKAVAAPFASFDKGLNDNIEKFFTDRKERYQAYFDEVNGINTAMEEAAKQTDTLFQKNIENARQRSRGEGTTKEAQDLLKLGATRKLTGEELEKILDSETKALNDNKKATDERVNSLQEALKIEDNPERKKIIQGQIDQLNHSEEAYVKASKAADQYTASVNATYSAILENATATKDKIDQQIAEQVLLGKSLADQIKATGNAEDKAILENQKAAADGNVKVLMQMREGANDTGKLQRKQLNALTTAYKDFTDNANKVETNATFKDLNAMQAATDKLLSRLTENTDNLSTVAAKAILDAIENQKVKLKGKDIAGSILSPEQQVQLLEVRRGFNEKAANEELVANQRKIDQIQHQENMGLKRNSLAQREILPLQLKSDKALIDAKQVTLNKMKDMGQEDTLNYQKAENELLLLQSGYEEKKRKITLAGIEDREFLMKRGMEREQALTTMAIASGEKKEREGEDALFKLKQQNSIKSRTMLLEKIADIKKNGGDFTELETQLYQMMGEYETNAAEHSQKLIERRFADRKNGLDKESAIIQKSHLEGIAGEAQASQQIFEIRQKLNLAEQQHITEQITEAKRRGKITTELENQLLQKQIEFDNARFENARRLSDKRKAQITNETTALIQIFQKELNHLDLVSKQLERQQNLQVSRNALVQTEFATTQGRMELQLKLTGDVEKEADIQYRLQKDKVQNLEKTQAFDRVQLDNQNKLQRIAIEREVTSNKIAKLENQRAIALAQIDLVISRREHKSAEEQKTLELQIESLKQQGWLLSQQGQQIRENSVSQSEIAANSEKELASRQTLAKQGGLLDLEITKRGKIVAYYEKQKQLATLYAQQVETDNIRISARVDSLTKAYELQSRILEAQKTAIESKTNRVASELGFVQQLTLDANKQRELAETIAQIKYRSLIQQQDLERKILDLQILQNNAAIEKEKIQLRSQSAQNKADVIGAFADQQKVEANIKSTPLEKQAAALTVQAKIEQGAAINYQQGLMGNKEALQDFLNKQLRTNLEDTQVVARDGAKMDIINNLGPEAKAVASERFKNELLGRFWGGNGYDKPDDYERKYNALARGNTIGLAQIFPSQSLRDRQLERNASSASRERGGVIFAKDAQAPEAPNIDNGSYDYDKARLNFMAMMKEFLVSPQGQPVSSGKAPTLQIPTIQAPGGKSVGAGDTASQSSFGDVKLQIEAINITIDGGKDAPKDAAAAVQNAILDELYTLGTKIKTRMTSSTSSS